MVEISPSLRSTQGCSEVRLYGFTATRSGAQIVPEIPLPLWLLAATPLAFTTVNVPLPSVVIVNVPLFPEFAIPVMTTF